MKIKNPGHLHPLWYYLESEYKRVRWIEAYSEPKRISKTELFTKIVNGFQPSNIFAKSWCSNWVLNTPLMETNCFGKEGGIWSLLAEIIFFADLLKSWCLFETLNTWPILKFKNVLKSECSRERLQWRALFFLGNEDGMRSLFIKLIFHWLIGKFMWYIVHLTVFHNW